MYQRANFLRLACMTHLELAFNLYRCHAEDFLGKNFQENLQRHRQGEGLTKYSRPLGRRHSTWSPTASLGPARTRPLRHRSTRRGHRSLVNGACRGTSKPASPTLGRICSTPIGSVRIFKIYKVNILWNFSEKSCRKLQKVAESCSLRNFAKLCETLRNFAKLCGTFRNFSELFGTLWNFSELFGTLWNFSELCGTLRKFSELCESFRNFAKVCGTLRKLRQLCGKNLAMPTERFIDPLLYI
jgi:hypothetical protein